MKRNMKALKLQQLAIAGTVESSDIQITIEPNNQQGMQLVLKSDVEKQYGRQIRQVIITTLEHLGVTDATVQAIDKGALDCTIKARTIAAVHRSAGITENIDWEALEVWNV